jgi:hypothetical protein
MKPTVGRSNPERGRHARGAGVDLAGIAASAMKIE